MTSPLTANNDRQKTKDNRKITRVNLFIVMHCLKEQSFSKGLTIGLS